MKIAKLFLHLTVVGSLCFGIQEAWSDTTSPDHTPSVQWIWTPVQNVGEMPNGACFFRRTFDVSRRFAQASLEVAADDIFEVYVNGEAIGRGEGWQHFTNFDISAHLRPGKNVVAIKVVNLTKGHAGLAAQIRLGSAAAPTTLIPTDESWRTTVLPLRKWQQNQFADQNWRPAQELGAWKKTAPWIDSPSPARVPPGAVVTSDTIPLFRRNDHIVPAAAEEIVFDASKQTDDTDVPAPTGPQVLRPSQLATPESQRESDQPTRWSTDLGTNPSMRQVRNPFVRQPRTSQTSRAPRTPTDAGARVNLPRIEVPKSAPPRAIPGVDPDKVPTPLTIHPTETAAANAPPATGAANTPDEANARISTARFMPFSGFEVEEVLTAKQSGSVIAATFNEFEQLIIAREAGPIMICTDRNRDGQFEDIREYCNRVTNCQGMLALSGMVFAIAEGEEGTGLYRLSDPSRKGQLDQAALLVKFEVATNEHGPHGITLGPDGRLYISCGNHTSIAGEFSQLSPRRHLYEGDLVPRYEDPGGHANGVHVPGGFVLRTDVEGKQLELFASGLRNVYDLAFNADSELFCHDSDMESDITTAWYRPTQVYAVPPGSEFGWRSGWSKWPAHFIDVTPPVASTGRGSPTGAVVYDHYAYPAPFRGVLFLGDWSRGRILVAKPIAEGGGITMETDTFLEGRPLNVTDLDIGPDGLLYFTTGGRGSEGGVFRVRWTGKPNDPPTATQSIQQALVSPQIHSAWGRQRVAVLQQQMGADWAPALIAAAQDGTLPVDQRLQAIQLMQWVGPLPGPSQLLPLSKDPEIRIRRFATYMLGAIPPADSATQRLVELLRDENALVRRQACESLVRANHPVAFDNLVPLLASGDRAEASAARLLLQLTAAEQWLAAAQASENPRVFLQSATALMVASPSPDHAYQVVQRSLEWMKGYLTDDDFVDLLRVLQLAVLRGELAPETVPELRTALAEEFPASHHIMNREMIRLLVRLQVTNIKNRYLDHLDSGLPEPERIHLVTHLRFLDTEWTMEEKLRLFKHLKPSPEAGGSVAGYLENIARDFSQATDTQDVAPILEQGALVPGAALEAVLSLPEQLSEDQIAQLIGLDQSALATDDLTKKLKVAVLAVLARSGNDSAMAHLRNVYDHEPARRAECTIGLAESPAGPNWPYLVKSLGVVEDEIARDVIHKLLTVERSPTDSEAYRQLILTGLRLGDDGGDAAVRLLERWRGFAPTDETPPWKDALRAWQNWFIKTFPEAPLPELTQRKQQAKWDYNKLVEHLGKPDTMQNASIERGKHLFVQAQCSKCHQQGSLGESMGPNLTALSSRFHLRETVESIMYPSKVISDQYKSKTLVTHEGQTFTGIVGSGGVDTLLVLQPSGEKVRLATSVIEQTVPSKISAMPEGLLDGLSLQEVADLIAFLQQPSAAQVADRDANAPVTTRRQ